MKAIRRRLFVYFGLLAAVALEGAFTLALLAACTPYWTTDMPGYRVQRIDVMEDTEWQAKCQRPNVVACTVRLREGNRSIVYMKPGLTDEEWACVLAHEARHDGGQNHDTRPMYAVNCGDN